MSLQSLMGSVSGLKYYMEAACSSVSVYQSNCNNSNLSEYHLKFNQLINKYSKFAKEYGSELDQFHKLLFNNIGLEKLEIISGSNSNLEISENLTEIEYSSENNSCFDQQTYPEPVPVPTPTPIKSKPIKSVKKDKTKKKVQKNVPRRTATSNKPKIVKNNNSTINDEKKNNDKTNMDKPYEYNLENVHWRFNGIQRSSTNIYIGNLPIYINSSSTIFCDEKSQSNNASN